MKIYKFGDPLTAERARDLQVKHKEVIGEFRTVMEKIKEAATKGYGCIRREYKIYDPKVEHVQEIILEKLKDLGYGTYLKRSFKYGKDYIWIYWDRDESEVKAQANSV